ncbi:hypothetical protein BDY21DRAFT_10774 [Lineolata rhizophorae]|uniref:Uncharacterized protein n=1 Tax=Lineolata rhizophorae TaxID=578093 RepID=A0A6A6PEN4_9PEZI|nr:hypothetical protein BDY21DRAFT_10774 [Lineolata rhizophorae]
MPRKRVRLGRCTRSQRFGISIFFVGSVRMGTVRTCYVRSVIYPRIGRGIKGMRIFSDERCRNECNRFYLTYSEFSLSPSPSPWELRLPRAVSWLTEMVHRPAKPPRQTEDRPIERRKLQPRRAPPQPRPSSVLPSFFLHRYPNYITVSRPGRAMSLFNLALLAFHLSSRCVIPNLITSSRLMTKVPALR